MPAYVYLVHMDSPLAHARHYIGCTTDPKARLTRHAQGHGARILQAAYEAGIEWRLGALGTCTKKEMRRIERSGKDQHNAARFCEICNAEPIRIGDSVPYCLESVPFVASSVALRATSGIAAETHYKYASAEDRLLVMGGVRSLMRQNNDELGFIPVAHETHIVRCIEKGQLALAIRGPNLIGYALFAGTLEAIRIQQVCVLDAERGGGIGTRLIRMVIDKRTSIYQRVECSVREDLPANAFWISAGFKLLGSIRHATSGSVLNSYSWKE